MAASPALARVLPFAVFVALTLCQGLFNEAARYWIYLAKTIVGAWFVFLMRPLVLEMRWKFNREAVVVGVAMFAIWVGLDDFYPKLGKGGLDWNPHTEFGRDSVLAWMFILLRIMGSSLVVPPLEEVFYRSFAYRCLIKPDFQSIPFHCFAWTPFLAIAAIFGFSHREWLAGIVCGMAYQWLVIRKGRLGDAMTAHAVTNFLLGLWVVWRNAWQFW